MNKTLKKVLIWAVVIVAAVYLVKAPAEFGQLLHNGILKLGDIAQALIVAVKSLFGLQ
jgi:hypothetical protein